MDSSEKYDNPSPEVSANILSKLFFSWIFPFFKYGYKNNLTVKDMYNTTDPDKSSNLGDQLERNWNEEIRTNSKPQLLRAIRKTFCKTYSIYGIWFFLQSFIIRMIEPLVLSEYIRYFEHNTSDLQKGWILATLVSILALFNVFQVNIFLGCQRIGMRCRVACCSLIYRKLLRLNQTSTNQTTVGQLINLLSNDVQRFDGVAMYLHFIWIMPFQLVVSSYILFNNVGYASITVFLALFLQTFVLQSCLSRFQGKLRAKIAQKTDQRLKLMHEIIAGIQVIKMYAWEKLFEKLLNAVRKLEINHILKTGYIKGFSVSSVVLTERLSLYLMVLTCVLLDYPLTAHTVFSMAQLMYVLKLYFTVYFPYALTSVNEAKVSIRRLEEFLVKEEIALEEPTEDKSGSIKLTNVSASWSPNRISDTLLNLNLNIKPGTLCCITGSVGCGKTSLLHVLLKELPLKHGVLEISRNISYTSQKSWIFASNIKSNILFGQKFDEKRYKDVVGVCALQDDFLQFPFGDQTVVGESGSTLSGGQKARINLARSVYRQSDIYLFDDPLSAVDSTVGKHLFEKCIRGFLDGKTRILVTHQLQFLKQADLIVVMKDGCIETIGSWNEMNRDVIKEYVVVNQSVEIDQSQFQIDSKVVYSNADKNEDPKETEELITKQALSPSIYTKYYKAGATVPCLIFIFFLFVISQIFCNAVDLWITHWLNIEQLHHDFSRYYYIYVYTGLILTSVILVISRGLISYKICISSSATLHNKMFKSILQAPLQFFNNNPSGRILNRFSKDLGVADELLPLLNLETIQVSFFVIGILTVVFLVTPLMVVPAIFLGGLFIWLQKIFLATAQDVKRLEGTTRSPVFTHVSSSLEGISTIRACKVEKLVIRDFDNLQDQHTSTWFLHIVTGTAFGFYLNLICFVFITIQIFYFLITDNGDTLNGNVGLAISQSLILTGVLQFGVRQTAAFASNMTNVERMVQYTKLDKEGSFESLPINKPKLNWPDSGRILFRNVYLSYGLEDPPVLKNINIEILPGEKIGIVGRTGAGKSSLIAALFRLAHSSGEIEIDGINIESIGLWDLRKNISIIPQKPILFSTSIKHNLDPFDKVNDETLWRTLENVELKNVIKSITEDINSGGVNFSVGQQQLICLARAIVRNNKILVMDEGTANLDHQTDELIQKTIRNEFRDCTILTVAHRLNTVIDSDRVLVMDNGEVVEFDHPHILLQKTNGYFRKMVNESACSKLQIVAKELYNNKINVISTK